MTNQNSGHDITIGMGATINGHSDRTPATIIKISRKGNKITLQEDSSIRIDKNGISESQEYQYQTNTNGSIVYATLRKDGYFRVTGSKRLVSLGFREKYHDYSF